MWNKQATAIFLVYLTLSGHALRTEMASVEQALAIEAAQKGTSSMEPERAEEVFNEKLDALQKNPSMKMTGSGGSFFRFWASLSSTNREYVTEMFQDDIDAMDEELQAGSTEDNSAIKLQVGINKWFTNQQSKHPEKTDYHHCKFNVAALKGRVTANLTLDKLAELAPIALESDEAGQTCRLGNSFRETLASKPAWAKLLVSSGSGHSDGASKAVEDAVEKDPDDGGSLLEEHLLSLLQLSGADVADLKEALLQEAKSQWVFIIVIFVIIIVLICRAAAGSSEKERAREREWAGIRQRGREIQQEHNRKSPTYMSRRAGLNTTVKDRSVALASLGIFQNLVRQHPARCSP